MKVVNPDGKTSDFRPGQRVTYVPFHADGDRNHPDVEHGEVTSTNERIVFVRYGGNVHGTPTNPTDLIQT